MIRSAGGDVYPVLAAEEPHDEDEGELERAAAVGQQLVPLVSGEQAAPGGHVGYVAVGFDGD